jgi:transposase
MRDLFWLSDEAWAALEPHLPHNQPGKPRVADRRVISGMLHILKTGGRWRDVRPNMERRRPSTTGTLAGRDEVSGSASSPR